MILFISFMERATRRLLIQYPKRPTQNGMMQADRSHLPLKINTGVIPPIFASSLLLLPLTITQFAGKSVSPDSKGLGHRGAQPVSGAWQAALYAALRWASCSSASSTPLLCSTRRRRRTI
jgi:preprotein translocase subunit SecY